MGKPVSEKEKKLQKKLIPLNIFVCLLSLVAIFSLIFAPILTVDFGKIMRSEAMIGFVDETVNNMMSGGAESSSEGSSESGDEGENNGGNTEVDFMPVIAAVVSNVLSTAEGKISFSAYGASKVAFAKGDEKAQKVLDELFFGDGALVSKLVDSIANGITDMFKTDDGKAVIEEVVVSSIAKSLVAGLSDEAAAKLTDEKVASLTQTFKGFENVKNTEEAEVVADAFVAELNGILGDDFDNEKDGENVKNYIMNMYEDTSNETDEFSVEAMISIAVSKNVDLGNYNINGMFGKQDESEPNETPNTEAKRVTADEIDGSEGEGGGEEPAPPTGEGGGEEPAPPTGGDEGEEPVPPTGGDEGEEPVPPTGGDEGEEPAPPTGGDEGEEPAPPTGGDEERVICTTYEQLMAQMGLSDEEVSELKANLNEGLRNMITGYTDGFADYLSYYGYMFYSILGLAAPWLILFLFSFFHMLAKNKRFTMWYVKLFYFVPALLSLALVVAPKILPMVASGMFEGEQGPMIKAMLGGISSMLWISGLCYLLLWIVSITWAFPIKRKIRKERKAGPNGTDYTDAHGSGKGGKKDKKAKKSKKADKKGSSYRTENYGDYEADDYANDYSNGYGSGGYGNGGYGGNSYDDDIDGFDSPYTGSYYGSSYDDEY